MSKHKNLILVGFMGTGKTVVGQAAARALGFDYVDSDDLIERKAGKTILRIFAEDGEPHFRDLETEAIRSLASLDRHVVATGGGCVLRDENWEAMRRAGLVVCLAARPERLSWNAHIARAIVLCSKHWILWHESVSCLHVARRFTLAPSTRLIRRIYRWTKLWRACFVCGKNPKRICNRICGSASLPLEQKRFETAK
jgi:shikimate kinase